MPRKPAQRVVEADDKDDEGAAGKFLDSLPETSSDPDDDDSDEDDDDDSDESDDDDDDDDSGDGSGEGEPMPMAASAPAAPKPRGRPPGRRPAAANGAEVLHVSAAPRGIRGPRSMTPEQRASSPALNTARSFQENAYQEIDSLLASLNFGTREYEVRVERLDPEFDENDVPCSGNLATYKNKVSVDDIAQRFGGGTFLIKVFGPHPTTGRPGIIKQERFKVAGPPKPMKSHVKQGASDGRPNETSEVLRAITESNERNQQRVMELLERSRDAPSVMSEILPVLTPLIEKLFTKNDESTRALLELQREERKAEERRREEDKKAEEERKKDEREDRRREEDKRRDEERKAEERRRDDERKADEIRREQIKEEKERAREEREQERERAKEDRERLREEMKADAAEKQRQHERDMAAQAERAKQEQHRSEQHMNMLTTLQNAQMDAMQNRQESGGLKAVSEQLLLLKTLQGTLTGSDIEPTSFEKFSEGLQNVVTTVMPVAQQIISARRPAAQPAQQQHQQNQQFVPPKPMLVDLGPRRPALPNPPAEATPVQTQPAPTENPTLTPESEVVGQANDLIEFAMPSLTDDLLTAGTLLMKNVDLAVQRNMTAEQIVDKILTPFHEASPVVLSMAAGLDSDQLILFVESNVPADWAIMSPRGEELVIEAFELWSDDGAEGAA